MSAAAPAPMSASEAHAAALARVATWSATQPEPLTAMPPDVAMAIAIAPRHRRPALGVRIATVLHVPNVAPPPGACDPEPRAATCAVEVIIAHPPGMSHRVPPTGGEVVTVADVLASLDLCRAACERMGRRVVSRERSPARAPVALPVVPGIDAHELAPVDDYLPGRGDALAWDDNIT